MYHLHLIYDLVNLTACVLAYSLYLSIIVADSRGRVSNCTAINSANDNKLLGQKVRFGFIGLSILFYLAFTIRFGVRLNDWDDSIPGRCYYAGSIASPHAKHPRVDKIYLGITQLYLIILIGLSTTNDPTWRAGIYPPAIMQFIVHAYMMIALRVSNSNLLNDAPSEKSWGFGQVLALVMLGTTLVECAKSLEGM